MARFDRKVERQKKEFDFYHKEKTKKSKMTEFKENFSFRWIKINLRTVIYIVLDFLAVSLAFIPLLMKYYDAKTAFILGHGELTSLLVVLTFYFINKEEKPPLSALFIRYCFMALLLGATSLIAVFLV